MVPDPILAPLARWPTTCTLALRMLLGLLVITAWPACAQQPPPAPSRPPPGFPMPPPGLPPPLPLPDGTRPPPPSGAPQAYSQQQSVQSTPQFPTAVGAPSQAAPDSGAAPSNPASAWADDRAATTYPPALPAWATDSSQPVAPPATTVSRATNPATAPLPFAVPVSIENEIGKPWLWGGALVLAVLAWWAAMRRSHQLGDETNRLTREQRRLKSAHTNLQRKSEQLQKLSIHDPLTGTLNRNAFAAELRDRIDHLAQFHRPLNLIVFDLDHFKDINDRSGHLTGDIALKLVVGVVREHLVSDDVFGRFGGDEFLIACADQTLQATGQLAEVIRAAVESRAQTQKPPIPLLTLSIGIAQANEASGYQPDELFARADAALYEAKRQGRNRIVLADATLADRDDTATADASHRHL